MGTTFRTNIHSRVTPPRMIVDFGFARSRHSGKGRAVWSLGIDVGLLMLSTESRNSRIPQSRATAKNARARTAGLLCKSTQVAMPTPRDIAPMTARTKMLRVPAFHLPNTIDK